MKPVQIIIIIRRYHQRMAEAAAVVVVVVVVPTTLTVMMKDDIRRWGHINIHIRQVVVVVQPVAMVAVAPIQHRTVKSDHRHKIILLKFSDSFQ